MGLKHGQAVRIIRSPTPERVGHIGTVESGPHSGFRKITKSNSDLLHMDFGLFYTLDSAILVLESEVELV